MRTIVHLDADAFFAAVEQAADARLRGRPVAVGGEKRGIIASASYEARKFGVYTPMPTARARRLCPTLIVLPGDFERYEQFSSWMFGYCYDFTPEVEETSIDECYFDLSGARKPPVEIAQVIRKAIVQRLKITVSEGLGTNKLVSAIASKLVKPAGFTQIPPGGEAAFLRPLANHWLPGVGPKASARLHAAGLARIEHIAGTPLELLELLLGNQAAGIRQFAHGIDDRPLVLARAPQKSFSKQETFSQDLTDEGYVEATLRHMADDLFATVRAEGRSIRTLTVRVRYNDMGEDRVSASLSEPTDLETDVYGRLRALLRLAWKRRVSLRLVSLKLSNVYDGRFRDELPLDISFQRREASTRLATAIDALRKSRGPAVIMRGHDFRLARPPHEALAGGSVLAPPPARRRTPVLRPAFVGAHVPLRAHSYYSFLDSTLSPEAIVGLAKKAGFTSVALTDMGNLHGAVPFTQAARAAGIKPILGAEIRVGGQGLLLYVASALGYHNLCRLLSRHAQHQSLRHGAGQADRSVVARQRHSYQVAELDGLTEGLIALGSDARLAELFPQRFYRLVTSPQVAADFPAVAAPAIHHGAPADRQRYDILQSIRTLTLLHQKHPDKREGGRFHFRMPGEMAAACGAHPDWLRHAGEIAERCDFVLPFDKLQFPAFVPPDGSSPARFLEQLVFAGLHRRYGARAGRLRAQAVEELAMINAVGYADYFLMTWELLQECRRDGIDWITRGSAADSLVCYCLGISGVCPIRFDLYFKRFLNRERMALHKLPDIDIDFAHDVRDAVVRRIFKKFGAEHCAIVGGFSTFQVRSAFAEVAKVLGVAEHEVRRITERFPHFFAGGWSPDQTSEPGGHTWTEWLRAIPDSCDLPLGDEPYKTALETAAFLDGMPRHPKMHPCGVVLSRQPMHELMPTFIANDGGATTQFDMDAVEAVGLVKLDILAQGGLAALRDVKAMLRARGVDVDLDALAPWEDPAVWNMIATGGSRAVHHIESPAMIGLCRQCHVQDIDGLIAIVSVIRPGAANQGKKLAFTRRYQGLEPVVYPHPSLEPCLRSTYGLVVYEEHILQICEVFAGMSAGRADVLRRALSKQKAAAIEALRHEFVAAAAALPRPPEAVAAVWDMIGGFTGYAFCKAHSTAYGVEAYQSAWLKHYFPAEFMAAVLTNGKGFYDPLVYVLECHRLGLRLLPPSVNAPGPAFVPQGQSIRVPLTRLKGLTERSREALLKARACGPFLSITDFYQRAGPLREELEAMIRAGAFDEFGETRTRQFWEAQRLLKVFDVPAQRDQGWLIAPPGLENFGEIPLQEPTRQQRLRWESECFGFAVSGHPLELFEGVDWGRYCPVNRLGEFAGQTVILCGLVVEQRIHSQVSGEPMKFLSLADWTGIIETELFADTYRRYGLATVQYPVLEVEGTVEPFENGRGHTLRVLRVGKPILTL